MAHRRGRQVRGSETVPSRDNKVRTVGRAASKPGGAAQGGGVPAGARAGGNRPGAARAAGSGPGAARASGSGPGAARASGAGRGGASAQSAATGQAPLSGRTSWRSLKNWRVRSRLLLLIIIPTLTAVILGGTYIVNSVQNALAYQRVETLANLSYDVTGLAARLEDERDQTVEYIGLGPAGRPASLSPNLTVRAGATPHLLLIRSSQGQTAPWLRSVEADS